MKVAVEHVFSGTTTPYTSYDSTKTNLGKLICQKTGTSGTDKWAGPFPIAVGRPVDSAVIFSGQYPYAISINSTTDWVFLADSSAAAATRRILKYSYNRSTNELTYHGSILLTYPTATNHTITEIRVSRHLYTTGTAAVSGTAVTGTTTAWQTARFAAGARIGFGSTNPDSITAWHYISTITNDTSITLSTSAGTIADGAFVIEELRVITTTTNATATNGGLFVAKGINADDFNPVGTTIAAAVSTDNVKAVYWLKDAATVTTLIQCGIGWQEASSNTQHDIYVFCREASSFRFYKFNIRAALTVATGASLDAFTHKTGAVDITFTGPNQNNGCLCTLSHGPSSGTLAFYFSNAASNIYRCHEANLTNGSTTHLESGSMAKVPPGTFAGYTFSYSLPGFGSIDYLTDIDRLIITDGANDRQYVTTYNTGSLPQDHVWGVNTRQQDQSLADIGIAPHPKSFTTISVGYRNGIVYICQNSTAVTNNQIYAIPLAAHWDYGAGVSAATQNRLITPSLSTSGATKLLRAYITHSEISGSDNLGTNIEPFRLYARTSGISDDAGSWTLLDDNFDLSPLTVTSEIQLMFEFRLLGITCIPDRIYSCSVIYENDSTEAHYSPSADLSDLTNERFAWKFMLPFHNTVPRLRVRLYDAEAGGAALVDDMTSANTSSGPRSPGTVVNDASFGTTAWTSPSNASTFDNNFASVLSGSTTTTQYLLFTDFGFSIPTGSTILGIVVELHRNVSFNALASAKDARVRIVKGGAIGSTDRADTVNNWLPGWIYVSYGSSSDLWGETWTAADINGSTFGVAIATDLTIGNGNLTTSVNYARMTVYYTEPASTGTFEQSTNNGSSWATWTNADKANDQTYIRYTPSSLTNDIRVRAWLSLA